MGTLIVKPKLDIDAKNYIDAVQNADGAFLEPDVRRAINQFIKGCKADGCWNAIKASCILAGARTLAGALIPLKGTAPTNIGGHFVSADYNRKTGLKGNGINKTLNTNFNISSTVWTNNHMAIYASEESSVGGIFIGIYNDFLSMDITSGLIRSRTSNDILGGRIGFTGQTSSLEVGYIRVQGINYNGTNNGSGYLGQNGPIFVFSRWRSNAPLGDSFINGRIKFYSLGDTLNLTNFNNRLDTFFNTLNLVLP